MQTWNGTQLTSIDEAPILVIGPEGPLTRALAREIESLPTRALHAPDLVAAIDVAAGFSTPPSIVLVPEPSIEVDTFEGALANLRIRAEAPRLVPIAYGRAPDDARRREIRDVGVELALFGRFGRNALRFQVNRALSPWVELAARGELRAPKEWRTRTYSGGREKQVRCYSLSSGGAYFVTPRPWVVGSDISLELPVGRERLLVSGRIVYTNAGNDADRKGLPRGMAVAFRPLSEHIQQAIREDVTATHEGLEV